MNRIQDFNAGMSMMIVVLIVTDVVTSYGSRASNDPIGLWDIVWFLLLLVVFADSVIRVYNFWQRSRKKEPSNVIELRDAKAVDRFFEVMGKTKK